jgi:oxygen-dependent protoporphyrinogen oxidase
MTHFDRALLETVVEPLLTGVYGGDASRLSAQSVLPRFLEYERRYGSLVRAVRAEKKASEPDGSMFLSFKGGMQALTDALYHASAGSITRVHGEVTHIERQSTGWRVTTDGTSESAKVLIIALPAHRAAPLFSSGFAELASELAAIPYSSAITAIIVYKSKSIGHALDGFGFLVPQSERKQVAACTWINTKFPQRVSPGLVALRAFIVDADADELIPQRDEVILAAIRREFLRLMGIEAEPAFHTIYRWPLSMPQYVVGHRARVARIREMTASTKDVFLVGNAYDGIGVPDCVRLAKEAAEQIEA